MTDSQRSEFAHSSQDPSSSATPALQTGLNASTGSYELVFSALLLGLGGYGLDALFGTLPLFTIIGSCLGLIGATVSIFYRYRYNMSHASAARAEMAR